MQPREHAKIPVGPGLSVTPRNADDADWVTEVYADGRGQEYFETPIDLALQYVPSSKKTVKFAVDYGYCVADESCQLVTTLRMA